MHGAVLLDGAPHIVSDPTGKDWYSRIQAGKGVDVALEIISLFSQDQFPPAVQFQSHEVRRARCQSPRTGFAFDDKSSTCTTSSRSTSYHGCRVFRSASRAASTAAS